MAMFVVKETFTYVYGAGHFVQVPTGTRIEKGPEPRQYWVDPSIFPKGSIERHDAEHYGIRVPPDNVRETLPSEVDVYRGWQIHEDANGAWAIGPFDEQARAERADALYDVIDRLIDGEAA